MKPEHVSIDRLHPRDIPAAKRIIAAGVVEIYSRLEPTETRIEEQLNRYKKSGYLDDLDNLAGLDDGRTGLMLALRDGDRLVGLGGIKSRSAEQAEVCRMWFLPAYRGRGFGLRLLKQLEEFAKSRGFTSLVLDTSTACVAAVALFRRFGFVDIMPYKDSIGNLFLGKLLNDNYLDYTNQVDQ